MDQELDRFYSWLSRIGVNGNKAKAYKEALRFLLINNGLINHTSIDLCSFKENGSLERIDNWVKTTPYMRTIDLLSKRKYTNTLNLLRQYIEKNIERFTKPSDYDTNLDITGLRSYNINENESIDLAESPIKKNGPSVIDIGIQREEKSIVNMNKEEESIPNTSDANIEINNLPYEQKWTPGIALDPREYSPVKLHYKAHSFEVLDWKTVLLRTSQLIAEENDYNFLNIFKDATRSTKLYYAINNSPFRMNLPIKVIEGVYLDQLGTPGTSIDLISAITRAFMIDEKTYWVEIKKSSMRNEERISEKVPDSSSGDSNVSSIETQNEPITQNEPTLSAVLLTEKDVVINRKRYHLSISVDGNGNKKISGITLDGKKLTIVNDCQMVYNVTKHFADLFGESYIDRLRRFQESNEYMHLLDTSVKELVRPYPIRKGLFLETKGAPEWAVEFVKLQFVIFVSPSSIEDPYDNTTVMSSLKIQENRESFNEKKIISITDSPQKRQITSIDTSELEESISQEKNSKPRRLDKVLGKHIVDLDDFADNAINVIDRLIAENGGYTTRHQALCTLKPNIEAFIFDNDLTSEEEIFSLIRQVFEEQKYKGKEYDFINSSQIWDKSYKGLKSVLGMMILIAEKNEGIIDTDLFELMKKKLGISYGSISMALGIHKEDIFIQLGSGKYALARALITKEIKETIDIHIDKLMKGRKYVVIRQIADEWYLLLPRLNLHEIWHPIVLQEIIRLVSDKYMTVSSGLGQPYDTIHAAITRKSYTSLNFGDIVWDIISEKYILPITMQNAELRELLIEQGIIAANELTSALYRTLNGFGYIWSTDKKTVTITKR